MQSLSSYAMSESVSSSISIFVTISRSLLKLPNSNSSSRRYIITSPRNFGSQIITACFKSNEAEKSINFKGTPIPSYEESGFKEIQRIELDTVGADDDDDEDSDFATSLSSSGPNLSGFDDEKKTKRPEKDHDELGLKLEELEKEKTRPISERRRGRQLINRSNLLAKQVISIQSALSLGFVSQLWVDTLSWVVVVIEVRPNLLSGEIEKFFLEDIRQVGDVVLIQDEGVLENDMQMTGLETMVGYSVITPGRQNIGKVRGYTFNINSGAVESLELDAFGFSIIPSSLVSTYSLLVEDILEVVSDMVVVHEAAALRIQRLTKGFWGFQNLGSSINELEDYPDDPEKPLAKLDKGRSKRKASSRQKSSPRKRADLDDWELPKDYF